MTVKPSKPGISIVRATAAHDAQVAEFIRQVWDPGATAQSFRAGRNADSRANPALRGEGEPPTFLVIAGERVVGYVSTIPVRVWLSAQQTEINAGWVKGLMVLPEHRNGPLGVLLAKELVKHHPVLLSLTVQPNARRLFLGLGFKGVGVLTSAMRIFDPGFVLRSLDLDTVGLQGIPKVARTGVKAIQALRISALAGMVLRAAVSVRRLVAYRASEWRFDVGADPASADIDALWNRAKRNIAAAVVRDSAHLSYRYRLSDRTAYTPIAAYRSDGSLAAVAYIRHPREDVDPRLRGIRIATLSDVVYDPGEPRLGAAIARAAERVAQGMGAHAIISSDSVPGLARELSRLAWFKVPGSFLFSTHDVATHGAARFPESLDQWWLTRGDGGSDGGL